MKRHSDRLSFRDWLIRQLMKTRFSSPEGLPLPALAEFLGVQLSVLEESVTLRNAELASRGRPKQRIGRSSVLRDDYEQVRLYMPDAVHAVWKQICDRLQVQSSALFRSLIHHFLLEPVRPKHLHLSWMFQGKLYQLRKDKKTRPFAAARITRGALIALDTHSSIYGVKSTVLLRALVLELVEGRTQRLKIVSFPEMWGDSDRYLARYLHQESP